MCSTNLSQVQQLIDFALNRHVQVRHSRLRFGQTPRDHLAHVGVGDVDVAIVGRLCNRTDTETTLETTFLDAQLTTIYTRLCTSSSQGSSRSGRYSSRGSCSRRRDSGSCRGERGRRKWKRRGRHSRQSASQLSLHHIALRDDAVLGSAHQLRRREARRCYSMSRCGGKSLDQGGGG